MKKLVYFEDKFVKQPSVLIMTQRLKLQELHLVRLNEGLFLPFFDFLQSNGTIDLFI
jgi:hypothetical protein